MACMGHRPPQGQSWQPKVVCDIPDLISVHLRMSVYTGVSTKIPDFDVPVAGSRGELLSARVGLYTQHPPLVPCHEGHRR